jgi:hypothetical protein
LGKIKGKLKIFSHYIKLGEFGKLFKNVKRRLYSVENSFGLKRDLNIPFENPDAKIELSVRLFQDQDVPYFNKEYIGGVNLRTIPNCYVAVSKDDEPFYRQWLIGSNYNNELQTLYAGSMPVLNGDEALLEAAYTTPTSRGMRIMPAAMSRIAEKAKDIGDRYVITFVLIDNIPSLKGCKRSGFHPYIIRIEKWFLFKRKVMYTDVTDPLMTKYLNYVADR